MNLRVHLVLTAAVLFSLVAFAQNPITADSPFQISYAGNLSNAASPDSVVNISNSGATGGNLCASVYVFSADEQEVACCSCVVTPNALVSLSARQDLISNVLTPRIPSEIVVKVLFHSGNGCNAATPGTIQTGGLAWGTKTHATNTANSAFSITETAFTPASLSAAEYTKITSLCGFIQTNGSTFGICKSCRLGALGGSSSTN